MMKINLNTIYQWPFKKQMPIFGIIFIVIIIIGYSWNIANLKTKILSAQDQEAYLKQQINMVIDKEAAYKAELAQYPTFLKTLIDWKAKLILSTELSDLLKDILKIGATNNIFFSLFDPADSPVKDGTYDKIPINMIMVGSYNKTADFISQLSNMPRIIVIRDFTISNENKADEIGAKMAEQAAAQHLLTTKMQIEIYIQPETKS